MKPAATKNYQPLGTVSLRGKIVLGVINDNQIDNWKRDQSLPNDFDLSPFVAFHKLDGPDFADLKRITSDLNETLIYQRACAELRQSLRPTKFVALCRDKGLDLSRVRIVIVPEGLECSRYIGRLIKRDAIELGSFHYNGNLTLEFYEPYQAMEAKRDASKSGSRTQAVYIR